MPKIMANIWKISFTFSLCRVDPTIGLDKEQTTPLQLAARKGSLEIIAFFTELVKDPTSSVKIKLLKLIIECEEEQDANVEAFRQHLKAISEARSLQQSKIQSFLSESQLESNNRRQFFSYK